MEFRVLQYFLAVAREDNACVNISSLIGTPTYKAGDTVCNIL